MSAVDEWREWADEADRNEYGRSVPRDLARAAIAELEARLDIAICVFCGAEMKKDPEVMLEHAKSCKERPENRLMERIAELEADRKLLMARLQKSENETRRAEKNLDSMKIMERNADWKVRAERAEAEVARLQETAIFKELVAYKELAEQHIDEAEAELAALKIVNGNLRSALEDARREA